MIIISGFKKDFLGLNKEIAYPSMEEGLKFDALNYGQVYDFTHFSLVMNRKLKSAIYVAYNIDKKSVLLYISFDCFEKMNRNCLTSGK